MVVVSALTLAVPLIGWQSVSQLYLSLQQTRMEEQTLMSTNLRASLAEQTDVQQLLADRTPVDNGELWYAETATLSLFVDGYSDDWRTLITNPVEHVAEDGRVSVRVARRGPRLFLFIRVEDDSLVWHRPPRLIVDPGEGEQADETRLLSSGDAIQLLMQHPDQPVRHVLIRAIAPGELQPLIASDGGDINTPFSLAGQVLSGWQGAWVVSRNGYQVEIELPLPAGGTRMAIAAVDVDESDGSAAAWVGSMAPVWMQRVHAGEPWPDEFSGARLQHVSQEAMSRLRPWVTPGSRARLYAVDGSLVADVNALYDRTPVEPTLWDSLLYRIFAWFVAGDLPLFPEQFKGREPLHLDELRRNLANEAGLSTMRYVTIDNDRVLGTLSPLMSKSQELRGYLLYESNEEHASAYSGSRLARLFSLLLLVSLLAGSALLIYAITLSFRVRRLSRQARVAVSSDGRVKGLPTSRARDEIGDLSRDLSSLLTRSAAYTDYLEALSSRLSHELKTPLSVVRTSIENLDRDVLDEQSQVLVDRASDGADQLASIIRTLVESTRLEQIVQGAIQAPLDLERFAINSLQRYQQVYPDTHIELGEGKRPEIIAAVELLQQALDKLVDNASDFSIDDRIRLIVTIETLEARRSVCLAVANRGSLQGREVDADSTHLGLGLAVVRMVAEAHGGEAFIDQGANELVIGMRFPLSRRAPA